LLIGKIPFPIVSIHGLRYLKLALANFAGLKLAQQVRLRQSRMENGESNKVQEESLPCRQPKRSQSDGCYILLAIRLG
jgi:hypothetical protein